MAMRAISALAAAVAVPFLLNGCGKKTTPSKGFTCPEFTSKTLPDCASYTKNTTCECSRGICGWSLPYQQCLPIKVKTDSKKAQKSEKECKSNPTLPRIWSTHFNTCLEDLSNGVGRTPNCGATYAKATAKCNQDPKCWFWGASKKCINLARGITKNKPRKSSLLEEEADDVEDTDLEMDAVKDASSFSEESSELDASDASGSELMRSSVGKVLKMDERKGFQLDCSKVSTPEECDATGLLCGWGQAKKCNPMKKRVASMKEQKSSDACSSSSSYPRMWLYDTCWEDLLSRPTCSTKHTNVAKCNQDENCFFWAVQRLCVALDKPTRRPGSLLHLDDSEADAQTSEDTVAEDPGCDKTETFVERKTSKTVSSVALHEQ